MKVLVVDDDQLIQNMFQFFLTTQDYEVTTCGDASTALDLYKKEKYPLIITDIMMSGIDGYGFCREMRKLPDGNQPFILAMTAYNTPETLRKILEAGADDYLEKTDLDMHMIKIRIEIAERKIKERQQLEETVYLLKNSIEKIQLGITISDTKGNIIYTNPAEADMHGYTVEELIGQKTKILAPVETWGKVPSPPISDMRKWENWKRESINIRKDGTTFPVQIISTSVKNKEGNAVGIISTCEDVTERKIWEETLHKYSQELEEHNRDLDTFSYTVAHDLKNPLSGLIGLTELLKQSFRDMTDEEQEEILNSIMETGERMDRIIKELLLLANIREMKEIPLFPLEMDKIVDNTIDRLSFLIKKQRAEIKTPETWHTAIGYAPWIEEVWANYISNGIKYGGTPPDIQLGSEEQEDNIIFWVKDNGMGIKPEEQSKLFVPFTRLKDVVVEGHGLGLSIVKNILTKLNGEPGVKSEEGTGSIFYFSLPKKSF